MDLWIRSQDKEILTVVKDLCVGGYGCKEIIGDSGCPLGIYKTKERALEVLDEIQSLIETNFECCYNQKIDAYLECNDVYEMPKE